MLRFMIGTKDVTKAAEVTYKTVWVAGPSVEYVEEILPVYKIVERLIQEK